jgi:hypothetical protein
MDSFRHLIRDGTLQAVGLMVGSEVEKGDREGVDRGVGNRIGCKVGKGMGKGVGLGSQVQLTGREPGELDMIESYSQFGWRMSEGTRKNELL